MNPLDALWSTGFAALLHAPSVVAPPRGAPTVRARARTALERRRRAHGALGVAAFVVGRPLRRIVSLEHYTVLARSTADVQAPPGVTGLAVVRLEPNSSSLHGGRLVEGVTPPRSEGLPRGQSLWLGLRDEAGMLCGRACLELKPERGTHRGWSPALRRGEAVASGLWIHSAVRARGAGRLLVAALLAAARDEHAIETVYGIVHRYNTASMLQMRVVSGFNPVGDAWTLRLGKARFALGSTLQR